MTQTRDLISRRILKLKASQLNNTDLVFKPSCNGCGKSAKVTVNMLDYARYEQGELVQKVWPDLSLDDREALISTRTNVYICGSCFDKIPEE